MSFVLFDTLSQCCDATSILDGIINIDSVQNARSHSNMWCGTYIFPLIHLFRSAPNWPSVVCTFCPLWLYDVELNRGKPEILKPISTALLRQLSIILGCSEITSSYCRIESELFTYTSSIVQIVILYFNQCWFVSLSPILQRFMVIIILGI